MHVRPILISLALFIVGIGGSSQAEPLRVACGATSAVCEWLEGHFNDTTDGEAIITRASSGEVLQQLDVSVGTQPYDLWWGGTGDTHIQAGRLGLLQPFKPERIDQQLLWSRHFWDLSEEQSIGIYAGTLVLVTNRSALLPGSLPAVSCWSELGDPQYRGQLLVADPGTSGTSFAALATILQLYDEAQARRLIREIRLNVQGRATSGYETLQRVLMGERAVTLAFAHDVYPLIDETDGQVVVQSPCEGSGYEIGAASISRDARSFEKAKAFIDFTLTEAVQNQLVNGLTHQMFSNVGTNASSVYQDEQLLNVIHYDVLTFSSEAERHRVIQLWE